MDIPSVPACYSVRALKETAGRWSGCALTIGNFDGVHRGHQAILSSLVSADRRGRAGTVAVTFEPHPVQFFRPDHPTFRLTTPTQKYNLLKAYGVDTPIFIIFDSHLSELKPGEFVEEILAGVFAPAFIAVGYDFNFGKGRKGTPQDLKMMCRDRGIEVEIVGTFLVDGAVVSSSRIRRAIRDGDLAQARCLLGRPYTIVGRVVPGAGRGRTLGFPTANIDSESELLPMNGVYASYLEEGDCLWQAATNIGLRPTFGGTDVTGESFVLDHEAPEQLQLYGRQVALHLVERLRPERSFASLEALVAQIQEDVQHCRTALALDSGKDIIRRIWSDPRGDEREEAG